MRKIITYISICLLTIACTEKLGTFFPTETDAIQFGAQTLTKGMPVISSSGVTSIGMFASSTNGIFANNLALKKSTNLTTWSFNESDNITWPETDIYPLNFIAHTPVASSTNGITVTTDSNDKPQFTYTTPTDIEDQPDFMISEIEQAYRVNVVPLKFNHQLSKITFAIKGDKNCKLNSITIKDIATEGTLAYNTKDQIYKWTLGSAKNDFTASINKELSNTTTTNDPEVEVNISTATGHLFLLPQNVGGKSIIVEISDNTNKTTTKEIVLPDNQKWDAGKNYNYTIALKGSDIEVEYTQNSNCYMLHPKDNITTYYIPVDTRVNEFWGGNGYENEPNYTIASGDLNGLACEILWYDCDTDPNITLDLVNSGFTPKEIKRPFSNLNGDFTPLGTTVALKVTNVSTSTPEGNVIVAVTKDNVILWSWHLWISDYDPDYIYDTHKNSIVENTAKRYTASTTDAIDRYERGNWSNTGRYKHNFIMDRNLGAISSTFVGHGGSGDTKGMLYYQYGRKDPFPANAANDKGFTLTKGCSNIPMSVNNPSKFATSLAWTGSKYESISYIWNDPKITAYSAKVKSIFDPSPLGWQVPLYDVWSDFDKTTLSWSDTGHNYSPTGAYYPVTGYRSYNGGGVSHLNRNGFYWTSQALNDKSSYSMNFTQTTLPNANTKYRTNAFTVRPISE